MFVLSTILMVFITRVLCQISMDQSSSFSEVPNKQMFYMLKDPSRFASCANQPNGWVLPWGSCERFFTVCSDGRARYMDCARVAQLGRIGYHLNADDWVFDASNRACTKRSECRYFNTSPLISHSRQFPVIASPPPVDTDATCLRGAIFSLGQCNKNYVICVNGKELEFRWCPYNRIFDPISRMCQDQVPGCQQQIPTRNVQPITKEHLLPKNSEWSLRSETTHTNDLVKPRLDQSEQAKAGEQPRADIRLDDFRDDSSKYMKQPVQIQKYRFPWRPEGKSAPFFDEFGYKLHRGPSKFFDAFGR